MIRPDDGAPTGGSATTGPKDDAHQDTPAAERPRGDAAKTNAGVNGVRAVARCLDILEKLAQKPELGLIELGHETGLRPPTVHRLLGTLVQRGYVIQNSDTDRYFVSYKLLELVTQASSHGTGLEGLAREHLTALRDLSGETTSLGVLIQDQAVWIAQEDADKILRPFAIIGRGTALHITAGGKAMLAFQEPKVVERFLTREPFPAATRHTITTRQALEVELDRIVRRGFAVDQDEQEESVTSIAAPIFDARGYAIAAISVCGPSSRMQGVIADSAVTEMLLARTRLISCRLGAPDKHPGENSQAEGD